MKAMANMTTYQQIAHLMNSRGEELVYLDAH